MFNLLTEAEKTAIKDYIFENMYSPEVRSVHPSPNFDLAKVLLNWAEAKSDYLFKAFGEQLIVEKDIRYEEDFEELSQKMRSELAWHPFTELYKEFVTKLYNPHENFTMYYGLRSLVDPDNLVQNVWNGSTIILPVPDKKTPLKLEEGGKIIKFLIKVAKAFNIPHVEDFANKHSQVLNRKFLKGKLCLSIHPLDYMTMSDNNCDWTSCMSWTETGCYRQGTVEMMNSPMVVVAYLKSESTDFYPSTMGFKWNSKKWRELFIITPDIITGIKGYPYHLIELEKIALQEIKSLVETNLNWNQYDSKIHDFCNGFGSNYTLENGEEKIICVTTETKNMYNDFINKDTRCLCYLRKDFEDHERITIHYSGKPQCIICGEEIEDNLVYERILVCETCAEFYRCPTCDCIVDPDESNVYSGEHYCDGCWDNMDFCASCEGLVSNNKKYTFVVEHVRGFYESTIHLCETHYKYFVKRINKYITKEGLAVKEAIKNHNGIHAIAFNYDYLTLDGIDYLNL